MTIVNTWLRNIIDETAQLFSTDPKTPCLCELKWTLKTALVLRDLSEHNLAEQENVGRSESNPSLAKYCLLYDTDRDIEIRLNHYYQPNYELDSVHNHKWKFVSLLLRGSVDHYVFPPEALTLTRCLRSNTTRVTYTLCLNLSVIASSPRRRV